MKVKSSPEASIGVEGSGMKLIPDTDECDIEDRDSLAKGAEKELWAQAGQSL